MGRKRQRRQAHGSAWHWEQTNCWYYTLPGTRKRIPLFDEAGERIRGKDNKEAAELGLARIKLTNEDGGGTSTNIQDWLVAKVCSEYLQHCERRVANGTMSRSYHYQSSWYLNDLCSYCGALPVAQLKKGHVQEWVDRHPTWKSPASKRSALTVVVAAFNYAEANFDLANPLKGLRKPAAQPRLQSLTPEAEQALYQATDEPFRDFLFASIQTGLRPFCELARMTAEMVIETERGMMWRVYSSKTRATRKIPVRAEVAALTRKLLRTAPAGSGLPLFRNASGKRWTPNAGVVRFLGLKKKLGWDQDPIKKSSSCYTCRHTFAHRMLSGYWNGGSGCSIETLAELMGDTPKVAFDHYGKEWGQHYQDPLWAAIGGKPSRLSQRRASSNGATSEKDGRMRGRQGRRQRKVQGNRRSSSGRQATTAASTR